MYAIKGRLSSQIANLKSCLQIIRLVFFLTIDLQTDKPPANLTSALQSTSHVPRRGLYFYKSNRQAILDSCHQSQGTTLC